MNIIYWFRNDLRLHDNEGLWRATQAGRVIPVYIFDESLFEKNFLGIQKMNVHRLKFLIESVADLKRNLQRIGSDLIVRTGKADEIITKIAAEFEVQEIYASKEITQDENLVESRLAKNLKPINTDLELIWESTLYHARDLPFQINFLPNTFEEFKRKLENFDTVRATFPSPDSLHAVEGIEAGKMPTLQDFGFEEPTHTQFLGGETEAINRLEHFLQSSEPSHAYFSAWLATGCISPRTIYERVKKVNRNSLLNLIIDEILWRDYFHFIALKYGNRIFKKSGIGNDFIKRWKRDEKLFAQWKKGETKNNEVNELMKKLNQSGYLTNAERLNVATYLVKNLGIEWTWGAAYFETQLIDYEASINWGNWNLIVFK